MPNLPSLAFVVSSFLGLASIASAQCDQEKLYASDASAVDEFGLAIAATADRVLVGAPSATGEVFGNSGAAYVIERQAGGLVETAKLFAAGGGLNEEFGAAVALDGSRAAIGAYRIGAPLGSGACSSSKRRRAAGPRPPC